MISVNSFNHSTHLSKLSTMVNSGALIQTCAHKHYCVVFGDPKGNKTSIIASRVCKLSWQFLPLLPFHNVKLMVTSPPRGLRASK